MTEKIKKSAETLMSMSTEYLLGRYNENLYVKMVNNFGKWMGKECDINTVEGARNYLISEGIDPDKEVEKGLRHIEKIKNKLKTNE